jgi:hypothetical protein
MSVDHVLIAPPVLACAVLTLLLFVLLAHVFPWRRARARNARQFGRMYGVDLPGTGEDVVGLYLARSRERRQLGAVCGLIVTLAGTVVVYRSVYVTVVVCGTLAGHFAGCVVAEHESLGAVGRERAEQRGRWLNYMWGGQVWIGSRTVLAASRFACTCTEGCFRMCRDMVAMSYAWCYCW